MKILAKNLQIFTAKYGNVYLVCFCVSKGKTLGSQNNDVLAYTRL
jgi:hypothetical protein